MASQADATRAGANGKTEGSSEGDVNLAQRQRVALDLRGCGYGLEYIMAKCGFKSHSAARRALAAARKAVAEETAEEHRLNFLASYGPVRQALHAKARQGNARAVEALVKLDERQCRLFGLDLTPDAAMLNVQYTKRIVLETTIEPAALPAPAESEPGA